MKRVLPIVWFALRGVYDELFPLAGMGLLWFGMTIVLPYGVFWLASQFIPVPAIVAVLVLISLIPAPPATAGLYYVATHIAREKRIEFNYYWQGFKSYLGLSWKIGAILLVSGAILVVDVMFYLNGANIFYTAIGFLGLWALLFWFTIQIYLFPLMIIQEDKSLKLILKNASLLTLAYPLFALGILIATILMTTVSVLLVILLATLWMPFVALLNSRATVSSLQEVESYRKRELELEAEQQEEEA
jgi:uncharacterized membrane protein YesL